MKKIDKLNHDIYRFSFVLRTRNPFENALLEKLNGLIKSGCTQKDAIMTLMCTNVLNNVTLDAPALKSVQSSKKEILKKESINKEISPNQQPKTGYEQKQVNNETIKNSSDDMQKKLQVILEGVNKYKE